MEELNPKIIRLSPLGDKVLLEMIYDDEKGMLISRLREITGALVTVTAGPLSDVVVEYIKKYPNADIFIHREDKLSMVKIDEYTGILEEK